MRRFAVLAQSLALAVLLTWPTVAVLGTEAVGSAEGDGSKHVWTLWWMRQELWHGTPGLQTTWVNFPDGMDLYPIEPLNGLLTVLLPLPPVMLSNLLALLHFTLLGVCTAWLGGLVAKTRLGAHVAGALAQGSAFAAFTLHVGVGELREYWWIPLGLGCLVQARETGRWPWFLALAASLAGAVISCFYHGLFLATAVALYALATLRPSPRLLLGYALAAGLSVGIVYPVVTTFSSHYGGQSAPQPIFGPDGRLQTDYRGAAMQLHQLVTPRRAERATADRQTVTYTGGRYLGVVTLVLVALGAAAAPRKAGPWLGVAAGCTVLSLGTVPWNHDQVLTWNGQPPILPLAWVNHGLRQVAEPINFPARFIAPGMIALAVVGALATRWRWTVALVPLALADVAYNELVPWPRLTFALPDMAGLAAGAGGGAVADVQLAANSDPESRTLDIAAQLELARPFQSVPIERQDKWAPSGNQWMQALPVMRAFDETWHGRAVLPTEDVREDQFLLRDRGFDRVVLTHRSGSPEAALRAVLEAAFGQPIAIAGHAHLYAVPMPTSTPEEQAAWLAAQAARVAALAPPQFGPQFPSALGNSPQP